MATGRVTQRALALRLVGGVLLISATAGSIAGCAPAGSDERRAAPAPHAAPSITPTVPIDEVQSEIEERLAAMDLRQKAASVLMLHSSGPDPAAAAAFMTSTGAGGFILMGDNVPSDSASAAPISAAIASTDPTLPPLIGIDQEGGVVSRLDDDTLPAAERLAVLDPAESRAAFAQRAALVRSAGASVNFGVVADITGDTNAFIFDRVFGGDAASAGDRVEQAVLGERGQVLTTLKHFPGHGRSAADSHQSIPTTEVGYDEWRATDAVPFERGIDAGAEVVMTGHLAFPSVDGRPASLSPTWVGILRDDLDFDGLIVTDDMLMLLDSGRPEYADPVRNAVEALAAGNDLLLHVRASGAEEAGYSPPAVADGIVAAVQSGALPEERLDDAAEHVLRARIEARDQSGSDAD